MISVGQTIQGRYNILRLVGRGGFATVYLAHDTTFERNVAFKVLSAGEGEEAERFVEGFLEEARMLAKLSHPNVLDVYDFGRVAGQAFLVMPYADGGTLGDLLRQRRSLAQNEAVPYFRQMVAALAYAHRQDIVHRDLKPQNMLLFAGDTNPQRLVIADFGLARVMDTSGLHSTLIAGTPYYMPPEQWDGHVGKPTDVYALGIIFYQCLSGEVPFRGENQSQLYVQHLKTPLPSLLDKVPELNPNLSRLIEFMCAKEPENRPLSQQLPQLLEEALSNPQPLLPNWTQAVAPTQSIEAATNLHEMPTIGRASEAATVALNPISLPTAPSSAATTLEHTTKKKPVLATPVRPRKLWLWGLVGVIVVALAITLSVIILSGGQPVAPGEFAEASATSCLTPASGGSGIGSKVGSFKTPENFASFTTDQSGDLLRVTYTTGLTNTTKYRFYNPQTGTERTALNRFYGDNTAPPAFPISGGGQYVLKYDKFIPPGADPQAIKNIFTLQVLEVNSGKVLLKVDDVYLLASRSDANFFFGTDGTRVAIPFAGGIIRFYDLNAGGKLLQELNTGGSNKSIISINDTADYLITATYLGSTVKKELWDIRGLKENKPIPQRSPVYSASDLSVTPDGGIGLVAQDRINSTDPLSYNVYLMAEKQSIGSFTLTGNKNDRAFWLDNANILAYQGNNYRVLTFDRVNSTKRDFVVEGLNTITDRFDGGIRYADSGEVYIGFIAPEQNKFRVLEVKNRKFTLEISAYSTLETGISYYKDGSLVALVVPAGNNFKLQLYNFKDGKLMADIPETIDRDRLLRNSSEGTTISILPSNFITLLKKKGKLLFALPDGTINIYNLNP